MTTAATRRPNLSALAVRAQAGDQAACDALLRGLLGWVPATLFKEVRLRGLVLDDADVMDLAQDIVLDVWRKDLQRFQQDKGDFLGFVMARVRWRLTDEIRRRTRHGLVSLDEDMESGHDHEAKGAQPDEKSEEATRELKLILLPAVVDRALSDDDAARRAVQSYDLDDKPLKEVASELGVHVSNACRARKRGLALLAVRLPQELRAAA